MRLKKTLRLGAIALFALTLLTSLFLSLSSHQASAAPKPKILAFLALQRRAGEVRNSLFAINANGSARRELVWSPDRTKIAFWLGAYPKQQIYTINVDGSNLKQLTNNPQNQAYNLKLFWSPDSSRIAYYYNKAGDRGDKQQDVYAIDINT